MFPRIIYGTAWKKERTTDLVIKAGLQGFRAIDTACQLKHYREDLVGEALKTLETVHGIPRTDFFVQTKFTSIDGQDPNQFLPYDPSMSVEAQVLASFAVSENRLGPIDSYLLHGPLRTVDGTLEAWKTIASLKSSGKVKYVGVSNIYDVESLDYLVEKSGSRIDVIQNRWYEGNDWNKEVVKYCLQQGIHYETFWTLTGSPSLLSHPALHTLAHKLSLTPAQTTYTLAQSLGLTPLAGSTDEAHMQDGVATQTVDIKAQGGLDAIDTLRALVAPP